ncbi:MAG TPA: DUF697 domain-containing protein [Methylomirabilota bacterium]
MKRIIIPAAVLIVIAFALIVARETREVVVLAGSVHPLLGQLVLWLLLLTYAVCVAIPVVAFVRLPKRLLAPPAGDTAGRDAHLKALARSLRGNRHLAGLPVTPEDPATIERALEELAQRARQRTIETATAVFVSTAVSQSGRLDGLMVLVTQSRLIWQIAHLYWQRPSLRDLGSLYANVATAAFVAQNVDDFDFGETLGSVVAPVLGGSAASAIPGLSGVASLIANSSIDGTVNAFLTLRIGCLASAYCRSFTTPDVRLLRRNASLEAARMLHQVARHGAERVSVAMWGAAKQSKVGEAAVALASVAARTAEQVGAAVSSISEASGAKAAAAFLSRIVTQTAARTSNAIGDSVRRRSDV